MLSMVTEIELGLHRNDDALLVMPMCHANSLNFFGAFAYCGGDQLRSTRARASIPSTACRTLAGSGATFTSLVPTHYIMMLGLPQAVRGKYNFDRVTKLMISSAPARRETKREVMEMFPNSGLFELYGSTEAGWVTMLHPHEQFTSSARSAANASARRRSRLLDEDGNEVPTARPASSTPARPTRSTATGSCRRRPAEAFRGDYCTVGDMARRDADGYIHLVRPQEQHDHLRRREHLSVRSRGPARRASDRSRTSR